MKYIILFLVFMPAQVIATSLEPKSLEELVAKSDHVIEVKITSIDAVDYSGAVVNDENAVTGPGSANEIRLHAKVLTVLKSNSPEFPQQLTVTLWRLWNYSLRQVKEASLNEKAVFLLEGESYHPVYPGLFRRGMHELQQIRVILAKEQLRKQFRSKRISPESID